MRTEQTERTSKVIGNALVACLGGEGCDVALCPNRPSQGLALYFGLEVKVIDRLNVWASVERNGQRFVVLCEDLKEVTA